MSVDPGHVACTLDVMLSLLLAHALSLLFNRIWLAGREEQGKDVEIVLVLAPVAIQHRRTV